MKKILIISILILTKTISIGQTSVTTYDTCQYLQQFEGEWKYSQGADTLKIYLKYHRRTISTNNNQDIYVKDCLIGWHEYKQGNMIIETDYPNRFITLPADISTIYNDFSIDLSFDKLLNSCDQNSKKLIGYIKDITQASQQKDVFATLNSSNTNMTVKIWHGEWYGHGNGLVGITLPTNIVLIKQ